MPGGSKKVTHTETNRQFSAAGLLKYVTFLLPPGIKGLKLALIMIKTWKNILPARILGF